MGLSLIVFRVEKACLRASKMLKIVSGEIVPDPSPSCAYTSKHALLRPWNVRGKNKIVNEFCCSALGP